MRPILAVSFAKSHNAKYNYFLSQWVNKWNTQYDIIYLNDVDGATFRDAIREYNPLFIIHNGHGGGLRWYCMDPRLEPDDCKNVCLADQNFACPGEPDYRFPELANNSVGVSHSCDTFHFVDGRKHGIAWYWCPYGGGIAYFGYHEDSFTINPFEDYNSPYIEDWYYMENALNDYLCEGWELWRAHYHQLEWFDRLIEKWTEEKPNEYWSRYVGYAQMMKERARITGDTSIKLDGTYGDEEPEEKCIEGTNKCIGNDLYECRNWKWVLDKEDYHYCKSNKNKLIIPALLIPFFGLLLYTEMR